ncbi:MAG TPA: hypothetical protein VIS55_06855 [Pseudomonadales bacterium]|jgi:hypothetical protein
MNYGFRRNTWALKPIALLVDLALVALVIAMHTTFESGTVTKTIDMNGPALVALAAIAVHIVLASAATTRWVQTAANAYAKQLLAACDTLASKSNSAT